MAKNMARIENGIVTNIEWCSNNEQSTDTLVELSDIDVCIGDAYDGTCFYRNGVKVLTHLQQVEAEAASLKEENGSMKKEIEMLTRCILEMSEMVYA